MKELPESVPKVKALLEHLHASKTPAFQQWWTLIKTALVTPQSHGSMRDWASAHNGEEVETLQATFDADSHVITTWEPGIRAMRWNPIGVRFIVDGESVSERRYRHLWTLAATEKLFIGYDRDMLQIITYHLVEREKV